MGRLSGAMMRPLKTAAATMVLCAALGACAMDLTPRPQYAAPQVTPVPAAAPAAAPAPAPAPAPVAKSADDAPKAVPSTPVEKSTLPPPRRGSALEPRFEGTADILMFAAASEDSSVTVGKGDTLAKIAKRAGVSMDGLAKANTLQAPYKLKLGQKLALPDAEPAPSSSRARTTASKSAKSEAKAEPKPAEPKPAETVTVGKGDTLQKLAKKAGVSMDALAKANGIEPPYKLKIGQKVTLSGAAAPDEAPASSAANTSSRKAAKPAAPTSVKVAKGQTLKSIAEDAGVPVAQLAKLNHLKKPYRVKRGQVIKLAADEASDAPPSSASKAAAETVTVHAGQTLKSIAADAGVSVAKLAKLNHLKKPYRVMRGQRIKLPVQAESDTAAASDREPRAESRRESRAEPPRTVTAGRHDTLQGIAEREGLPVAQLAKLNHLKKPYRIKRGQKIRLPGRAGYSVPTTSVASSYQVVKGDTLFSIARRFHTDARTLADANGLDVGAHLNAGRKLQLPGSPLDRPLRTVGGRPTDASPPQPTPYSSLPANPPTSSAPGLAPPLPSAPPATAPLATQQPYSRPPPAPIPYRPPPAAPAPYRPPPAAPVPYRPTPEAAQPPSTADSDVAAAGKGFFQWPVRGQLISGYGPKSGGQRNDGLDITAGAGESVRAAAAGEVVYAGNSVPGFGNLVLIRHDGGWVTAYAHLANIDVKMRQTVTQGQQIGEVGLSGGVDRPEVHFEVRYAPSQKDKARPIDPMLVLPPQP
jgi:LysM repeat protein